MKRSTEVSFWVEIELDETKFTPEFMEEFRQYFYDFYGIDEHIAHLAQLYVRGLTDGDRFIEGYGLPSEMGIKFSGM